VDPSAQIEAQGAAASSSVADAAAVSPRTSKGVLAEATRAPKHRKDVGLDWIFMVLYGLVVRRL